MPSINADQVPKHEHVNFCGETYRISPKMIRNSNPYKPKALLLFGLKWIIITLTCVYFTEYNVYKTIGIAILMFYGYTIFLLTTITLIACGGKKYTSWMAGTMVPKIMKQTDIRFGKVREELLLNLSGKVLDFGAGGGAYLRYSFKHIGNVTEYVCLEPNKNCHDKIRIEYEKCLANYLKDASTAKPNIANTVIPKLQIESKFLQQYVNDISEEENFDWIILGNVLCEVPEPNKILRLLDKLLKPGGMVYFSEHVRDKDGTFRAFLQDLLAPWWQFASDGCVCNRKTLHTIKENTSWKIQNWTFFSGTFLWTSKFEVGIAHKPLD